MKRTLLIAVVVILGATPAPPEAPRPGQALVESSAAIMAVRPRRARRPETQRALPSPVPPCAEQGRPATLGGAVGPSTESQTCPGHLAFLLFRRSSQDPPERA